MLPRGFLGTRADVLMDVVVLSLVVILPSLAVSWNLARKHAWAAHRRVQVTLASVLAVVVVFFEADLRMAGGIFKLVEPSRYANTGLMSASIWVHMFFSITTSVLWAWLLFASLRAFGPDPEPGAFSTRHKLFGKLGMLWMALTGITGVELYVIGFAL